MRTPLLTLTTVLALASLPTLALGQSPTTAKGAPPTGRLGYDLHEGEAPPTVATRATPPATNPTDETPLSPEAAGIGWLIALIWSFSDTGRHR